MNAPERIASPSIPSLLKNPALFQEQSFINGTWRTSAKGETFSVNNPATGEIIAKVSNMDTTDALAAIDAAKVAFSSWKNKLTKERSAIMRKWFNLIAANADDLAMLMTI